MRAGAIAGDHPARRLDMRERPAGRNQFSHITWVSSGLFERRGFCGLIRGTKAQQISRAKSVVFPRFYFCRGGGATAPSASRAVARPGVAAGTGCRPVTLLRGP